MEKIAFIFPGQGSQYVGMAKSIYDKYQLARQTFEEANDVLGFDLAGMCFDGSLADLSKTENAQLAVLTVSVVYFRVYMEEIGVVPQFCAGHSLGEYSALTCSGALRFADALKIIKFRSKLAQDTTEKNNGAMSIIDGIDQAVIVSACRKLSAAGERVAVSCYNSSKQAAISGGNDSVQKAEDAILDLGGQPTPLFGNAPFHCPLMQDAAAILKDELLKYKYHTLRWPVISNVTALPYEGPDAVVATLTRHMQEPVQWQKIMQFFRRYGVTMTIEMGPKNVLSNLFKDIPEIQTMCFDQKEDRKSLLSFFPAEPMYQKHIPTVITKCLAAAVATPNFNDDQEAYEQGVVEPYRAIMAIQAKLEETGAQPTEEQMRQALELLKLIFKTKHVTAGEQEDWFSEILEETGTVYVLRDLVESTE